MKSCIALFVVGAAGCWTGKAPLAQSPSATASLTPAPSTAEVQPTTPAAEHTAPHVEPSYRSTTIAVDVTGVATMTAGLVALHRGANEDLSGALIVTGMAIAGFGDPIVHLAHGRGYRALASYLIRAVAITSGTLVGLAAEDCRDELFCGLDGMLWGTAAGLAVAGVADAFVLHGELSSHAWTPTVTATDGGARVGIAAPF